MAVFVVSVVGFGAAVRIPESRPMQEQRYDKVRSSFIRISQSSAEILQSAFSFVQSDAEFVESGPAEPLGGGFWDKSEIGFYKIERLLHTIRDFGNKRRARESGIPLTLYSERSACGLPPAAGICVLRDPCLPSPAAGICVFRDPCLPSPAAGIRVFPGSPGPWASSVPRRLPRC